MIVIERTYRFCASHCLRRADWDDETNERVFGPSAHPSGHGHNFRLRLTIEGLPDPRTGRVLDVRELDGFVEERVVSVYDHRNLNADVPSLSGLVPSLETLLADIWERLRQGLPGRGRLTEIRLEIDAFLAGRYGGPR